MYPPEQAHKWSLEMKADPVAASQIKEYFTLDQLIDLLCINVVKNDDVNQVVKEKLIELIESLE